MLLQLLLSLVEKVLLNGGGCTVNMLPCSAALLMHTPCHTSKLKQHTSAVVSCTDISTCMRQCFDSCMLLAQEKVALGLM